MNKFKKGFTLTSNLRKGFTLIELLVVIAVIGVLSAIILVAINPVARINQANDAEVKSEIGQIATALATFATSRNGAYPNDITDLVTSQDLTSALTPPTGYSPATYTFSALPAGCTGTITAPVCTSVSVSGTIKVPVTATNTMWCYRTSTGTAIEAASCPTP